MDKTKAKQRKENYCKNNFIVYFETFSDFFLKSVGKLKNTDLLFCPTAVEIIKKPDKKIAENLKFQLQHNHNLNLSSAGSESAKFAIEKRKKIVRVRI